MASEIAPLSFLILDRIKILTFVSTVDRNSPYGVKNQQACPIFLLVSLTVANT